MEDSRPSLVRDDRRVRAPHPGFSIARDYLEPIGLDAAAFARIIGMDAARLAAMLEGSASFDVDAAVRVSRSLGISPERLMRVQLRHDFERSRAVEHAMPVPRTDTLAAQPFPQDALRGYLARVNGVDAGENLYFVHSDDGDTLPADLSRVHRINDGDRLRIFSKDNACVWAGPVLQDLDGRRLFVFAKPDVWHSWFDDGLRADWSAAPKSE
jgi:addiction module HigA family antidote